MNKNLVIFGPWCGEFCYELSWWIPEIRKQRLERYTNYDAFAVGFEGRKVLYKDFTEKYFAYTKELEDTLKYPATFGEHINGRDIIPSNLQEYVKEIVKPYIGQYKNIEIYLPGTMPISQARTMAEQPFGVFRHYDASAEIMQSVQNEIRFDNDRETVAVMARIRTRLGDICYLDWNPDHWKTFIEMIVDKLNVNVVMIGIPKKEGSSAGASLTFENTENIKNIIFTGSDSVERQIALLKQTKCSIYGASGTAVFPFFVEGAATFTQQTITEGFRLKFQWERDLTNNLKNVAIFDKYENHKIYHCPPEEMFEEFSKFYNRIL